MMSQIRRRDFGGMVLAVAGPRLAQGATAGTEQIDNTLRAAITSRKVPVIVALAATGREILYRGAFGTRDSTGVAANIDSIFAIHSMTKAITSVAALQLVEQGKLRMDEPASKYLPKLKSLSVLQGFEPATGKPILRPAKTEVTLRHLLTHTAGFCYDTWDGDMFRYTSHASSPSGPAAEQPLMFEPGTRWQYGQSVDWAGRLVEAVSGMSLEDYFQAKILRPLEMSDTSYILPAAKFDRFVTRYLRQEDGSMTQVDRVPPPPPSSYNGGGGLFSTAGDYARFMQMILEKGQGPNGPRILQAKTVDAMATNQIGKLPAGQMKSYRDRSSDVDFQPGSPGKWGFGFLINTAANPGGRSAGSLAWAGMQNTFFWIDPKRSICGVVLMQFMPFVHKEAIGVLGDFERSVYSAFRQG